MYADGGQISEGFANSNDSRYDFWADPSIEELIAQEGTGPIDDVSVLHGNFRPEEERIEDFIAALHEWRGHNRPGRGCSCSAPPLREESSRCTLLDVSPLENIVENLKSLPPARLEVAADFVHRLKRISEEERQAALARTFGCLSPEEAGELGRVIEEGCEQIDGRGW
jgi:hypothetical protein